MVPAPIDFAELLQGVPSGAWVAVWEHRVLAYGCDMQQVLVEAREQGVLQPIMLKAPDRPEALFF